MAIKSAKENYQNNIIGDFIAAQMFKDVYRTLKLQGILRVIST